MMNKKCNDDAIYLLNDLICCYILKKANVNKAGRRLEEGVKIG